MVAADTGGGPRLEADRAGGAMGIGD